MGRLESLSDQKRICACRLLPWEKRLLNFTWSRVGCAGVVLVSGLFAFGCHLVLRGLSIRTVLWPLLLLIGLPFAAILFFVLTTKGERRRRPFWRELQRRYAGLRVRRYLNEIESDAQIRGDDGADLIVLLSGSALPCGGDWLVQIRLRDTGVGAIEVRKMRGSCFLKDVHDLELSAGQSALSRQDCDIVRKMALTPFGKEDDAFVASTVHDGAPAEVGVWARGRGVTQVGACNLAGIPESKQSNPAIRLMLYIEELAGKVETPPLLIGSCDFATGKIRLTDI